MIFFSVLIIFSHSAYLGLDIGSYFSKASTIENNEIPTVFHNYNGSPNTPSFLAFRSKPNFDWRKNKSLLPDEVGQLYISFADNALRTMETRPYMGSGFWPLICNLNSDESEKYTKPFRMSSSAARVKYEDSLILFLKKYIDTILMNTSSIKDICFVFPATFLLPQRDVFGNALENIGIKKFHNIDDIDAVSYVYAIEHSEKIPKTILFIDIGGLSIKSYVVHFKKRFSSSTVPQSFRYSYVINRTEGGAHITRRLVDYIKDKTGIKNETDAEYHRLFKAAEKMKIDLTSHDSTFSIIENIGGIDIQFSMNKSDLEPFILPLIETTADVALKASEGIEFDEIEIIGGTSKNQYVIDSLSKILHHEILQTLPPDETLAIGAGYSNSFRHNDRFVPVEIIEEKSVYSIELLTLNGTFQICEKGKKCVDNIEVPNDAQVALFDYNENEIQKGQIVTGFGFYVTYIEKGFIQFSFKHAPFRVIKAFSCLKKDQSSCKENKIDPLDPPKPLSEIFKLFMNPELLVERLNETREQLKNFTDLVLHQVEKNQTFRSFTNYTQRLEIIRCAEKQKKWLLNDSKKVTQPINFTLRLNELKKLVFPVYQRIRDNNTLFDELGKLLLTIQDGIYGVEVSWPANRSYVEKEILKNFESTLKKSEAFLNDTIERTVKEPGWKSYSVSAKDVKEVNKELKLKYNKIQFANPPSSSGSSKRKSKRKSSDYWDQFKQNGMDEFFENDEKIQSYEEFVESQKDPFSIEDL